MTTATRSRKPGNAISPLEVTAVTRHGVWLLAGEAEYFLAFKKFPWFRKATIAQVASRRRVVVEALIYAALIGLAVSRAIRRRLRALVDAGRRVSERRVTDALGAIAAELAVVLAGVPASPEQLRRWHALLSAEAADPNVGRATMKRSWGC